MTNYNKAIEVDPKMTTLYYNRGNVYVGQKDYDKAISDFDRTIRLNPKHRDPRLRTTPRARERPRLTDTFARAKGQPKNISEQNQLAVKSTDLF